MSNILHIPRFAWILRTFLHKRVQLNNGKPYPLHKAYNASKADYSANIKEQSAVIPKLYMEIFNAGKPYYVFHHPREKHAH